MRFNDLLAKEGIALEGVLVLRHTPKERELRKVLPWLAAERPDLFNAFQQTQGRLRVEGDLLRARLRRLLHWMGNRTGEFANCTVYWIVPSGRSPAIYP
jgi:hypothetical protein